MIDVQPRSVVIVVQIHVVRVADTVLRRTPEVRVDGLAEVNPVAAPAASRERREPESIRTVTAFVPAFLRL